MTVNNYQNLIREFEASREKIIREIHNELEVPLRVQREFEERLHAAEKKLYNSMKNYIFGDIENAVSLLTEANTLLKEARILAWKNTAKFVQELTDKRINGLVKRTADLKFFHDLDKFNELLFSARSMGQNEAIENYKKALSMKESLLKDIERVRKKSSFDYFQKIALPIILASVTIAATAVYSFTKQIELVALAILISLVISIGLFSFIKGKLGKESLALFTCVLVIIWLGANIFGIKVDVVALVTIIGAIASFLGLTANIFLKTK